MLRPEKFDSTLTSLNQHNVAKYDSGDSCLLVVDRHLNATNWWKFDKKAFRYKQFEYRVKQCYDRKLPVPNFYREEFRETDNNSTGLLEYTLYVLDAQVGLFMKSDKLPNPIYTPPGWPHGYSKGVALNHSTKEVIYWADIW